MDSFFGIGLFELIVIAVIALIVMGPERLPGAMREVGKYARQLRDVSNEFQSQFSEELKVLDEINPRKIISSAMDPNAPPAKAPTAAKPAPAAKPLTAAKPPSPAPPPQPVVNGEASNSILPPPVAPPVVAPGEAAAAPEISSIPEPVTGADPEIEESR